MRRSEFDSLLEIMRTMIRLSEARESSDSGLLEQILLDERIQEHEVAYVSNDEDE